MYRELSVGFAFTMLACGSASETELFEPPASRPPAGGSTALGGASTGGTGAMPGGGGGTVSSGGTPGSGGIEPSGGRLGTGATGGVPSTSICGNGVAEAGEECDDGNTDDGDGCSGECESDCSTFPGALAFTRPDRRTHCYWSGGYARWTPAANICESQGGHLVTVTSAEEDAFVLDMNPFIAWLGAWDGQPRNTAEPGTYAWVTGERFSYTNWLEGEPNNFCHCGPNCCEHCMAQIVIEEGWDDRDCNTVSAFICEFSAPGF